jgi:glycosyltransferase EpsE
MTPKISVIMGVYNCASTLPEAIASIQKQTITNWEFIICDDGSNDDTWRIADDFRENDDRIVLLKNEKNLGLNATLNKCLSVARGQYIARMDGDDICAPERFEKELLLYSEHPEAGVISCSMNFFDDDGTFGSLIYDEAPQPADLLHGSQFCHAGALIRRDVLMGLGGYSERRDTLRVEDFDLWVRMYSVGYRGFNTKEILYSMRDDRNAISRRTFQSRVNESKVILRAGKAFNCGAKTWLYATIPVMKSFCPQFVYKIAHKRRLNRA